MRCAVGLSTTRNSDSAFAEVLDRLGPAHSEEPDDIAIVFSSMHHADQLGRFAEQLTASGRGRHVIGCTGESIVGEDREVEGAAALSIWTARMPGVEIEPIKLPAGSVPMPEINAQGDRTLICLADPFTCAIDRWFKDLSKRKSPLRIVGGMASGSHAPGQNRLVLDGEMVDEGGVGLLLGGPVAIRAVVSQGCRPIGRHLVVTRAEANIIKELGRRTAVDVLREIFQELSPDDQERVQQGLHIGRVISEYQESFGRGDFLVRNVMGVDTSGGIATTDLIRVGQTVQFHVRDAETADEDLNALLESYALERPSHPPVGALLFSCNGRGTRLFPGENHDVNAIHRTFGSIPVAGFFAMGEFGPVGGENFVHGYTASTVFFAPQS